MFLYIYVKTESNVEYFGLKYPNINQDNWCLQKTMYCGYTSSIHSIPNISSAAAVSWIIIGWDNGLACYIIRCGNVL